MEALVHWFSQNLSQYICWKYYSYSVYSVVYQTDFQGFKKDETLSGTCYEIGRQGNEKK